MYKDVEGQQQAAEVIMLGRNHVNTPYLVDGVMPEYAGELAVTRNYLDETGKRIGDMGQIEEDMDNDETPVFLRTTYTITAVVIDPMSVSNDEGTTSFRSNADR